MGNDLNGSQNAYGSVLYINKVIRNLFIIKVINTIFIPYTKPLNQHLNQHFSQNIIRS